MKKPRQPLLKGNLQGLSRVRAVLQVQVDQRLIRDAHQLRLFFKILYGVYVDVDGDLFLQLFCVGVPSCVGEIIFFSHVS